MKGMKKTEEFVQCATILRQAIYFGVLLQQSFLTLLCVFHP